MHTANSELALDTVYSSLSSEARKNNEYCCSGPKKGKKETQSYRLSLNFGDLLLPKIVVTCKHEMPSNSCFILGRQNSGPNKNTSAILKTIQVLNPNY